MLQGGFKILKRARYNVISARPHEVPYHFWRLYERDVQSGLPTCASIKFSTLKLNGLAHFQIGLRGSADFWYLASSE
jgi:hypothetical protein